MMALWISLAVIVALLLVWRLHRAVSVLNRILREERERTISDAATERDQHRAEHPNR